MAASRPIQWKLLDHAADAPVQVGDMVSSDAGGMPIYRVQRLADGKVWLAGERQGDPRPMPLEQFCWRAHA